MSPLVSGRPLPRLARPWTTPDALARSAEAERHRAALGDPEDTGRREQLASVLYEDWRDSHGPPPHWTSARTGRERPAGIADAALDVTDEGLWMLDLGQVPWAQLPEPWQLEFRASASEALLAARFQDPEEGARYMQECWGLRHALLPSTRPEHLVGFDELGWESQQSIRDLVATANALIVTPA